MTDQPKSVRTATWRDEQALYSLLVDMWKHNDNGWGFSFRPEIVMARIETGTRPDPANRTMPKDERRGVIGVIDGPDGRLAGSVGLFIEPCMWFTDIPGLTEIWVYVRRGSGAREADLRAYAKWAHEFMKNDLGAGYRQRFPLFTGFVHDGSHFRALMRIWRRWGARQIGALFMVD